MLKTYIFICFAFSISSGVLADELKVSVDRLEQVEDREIASKAEVEIPQMPTEAKFKSCVPRESILFSENLSADLKARIFSKDPMKALMECKPGNCAFNFLPQEVEKLSKLKSADERKHEFWTFFKNRAERKTGLQENRVRFHIRSKDNLFEDCQSKGLAAVLDDRMTKHTQLRMSHIQYQSQMRPTTRLLQSGFFQADEKTHCYAEALIFSDHYDDDRVEVWSMKKMDQGANLKVQVRHRIDILNTWYRRLQAKEGLAQELDKILESQIREAAACLSR